MLMTVYYDYILIVVTAPLKTYFIIVSPITYYDTKS